jgi:hypothetical protein
MDKFNNIMYLKNGNNRQQKAWRLLTTHAVFETLQSYSPILTGTIPIEIDIEGSDLDIICCFKNEEEYEDLLIVLFSTHDQFTIRKITLANHDTIIANFFIDGVELEIFGQNRPVTEQEAYRHMIVENQLLQEKGEAFKQQIIDLKNSGLKTEPAFAQALRLTGDPYQALLKLYPSSSKA